MGIKQDFLDLGLFCGNVCEALCRALDGTTSDELDKSVHGAIKQLTT